MEALMNELVEEILLRLPPGDPSSLARAAVVCKRWCRIISDRGFRRRFVRRHPTPPVLGLLANLRDGDIDDHNDFDFVARFVPATPFCPRFPDHRDRCALDARHGRVLLTTTPWGSDLEVWDPVTDVLWELAPHPRYLGDPFSWNATVLCADHGVCDHLDCHLGRFVVVFLDSDTGTMRVHLYLSEAAAWSPPMYGPQSTVHGVETLPTALVGNALYFLIDATQSILECDLATMNMSVIPLPPEHFVDFAVLTTMEDGQLGFARIVGSKLLLWSMKMDPEGHAGWSQVRVLELETLLPADAFPISDDYVGFAHGVGVFFVPTEDRQSIFSIDLNSGWVRNEDCGDGQTHGVVPYTSFYTPDFHQYSVAPV
ncbi:hypothetical protein GQ55_2G061600 [Panicum hallii var. hallii]|uniref:F-box domain-containing protein n=1 Tax=Panicum hallii var. hallii TaxID=1504633 RepID=A0A2T7EM11_9POAL|nr:hypothetical protein GQ55_2G061600 [Panicum hallii var. hallii]PUZ68856.1 hypothetical protein GQ55_2G061600 [Panicum hallii var. hallii]